MKKAWIGLAAAAVTYDAAAAHACSVCLTGDGGPIADAYNWSVLFLMATPYTVIGCVGAWLIYKYRRAAAKQRRVEGEQPLAQLGLDYKESRR
jgi:hypothetical protein